MAKGKGRMIREIIKPFEIKGAVQACVSAPSLLLCNEELLFLGRHCNTLYILNICNGECVCQLVLWFHYICQLKVSARCNCLFLPLVSFCARW